MRGASVSFHRLRPTGTPAPATDREHPEALLCQPESMPAMTRPAAEVLK